MLLIFKLTNKYNYDIITDDFFFANTNSYSPYDNDDDDDWFERMQAAENQ